MARVELNQEFINRIGTWGPVDRDLEERARRVASMARGRGPIETGDYVSSIEHERLEGGGWRVIARDRKSWWIEAGTKPHVIRPRHKKALWWPGLLHPVKSVLHPGTIATHNLAEALELASRGRTNIR